MCLCEPKVNRLKTLALSEIQEMSWLNSRGTMPGQWSWLCSERISEPAGLEPGVGVALNPWCQRGLTSSAPCL